MKSRDMLIAEAVRDACYTRWYKTNSGGIKDINLPTIIASVPGDEPAPELTDDDIWDETGCWVLAGKSDLIGFARAIIAADRAKRDT